MGTVNHGDQQVNYSFFDELRQEDWARKDNKITPRGVYYGGYLTIASPTELTLSVLKAELGDANIQVSIGTADPISITDITLDSGTLDPGTPYIVLRYAYAYDPNNFFEIHAVATPLPNDIVVGKVVGSMVSIDYAERSEPVTLGHLLGVVAAPGEGLYVRLHGGSVHTDTGSANVANQLVGPFSPPSPPNNRIDLVYITAAGTPAILQGVAAVSPVAPEYAGKLVLAEITVSNGVTEILEGVIADVRSPYSIASTVDDVTIYRNGSGELAVKQGLGGVHHWDGILVNAGSRSQGGPTPSGGSQIWGSIEHGLASRPDFVTVNLYNPATGERQNVEASLAYWSTNLGGIHGHRHWDDSEIWWAVMGSYVGWNAPQGFHIDATWRIEVIAGYYIWS